MTPNLPPLLVVDDEKNMRLSLETIMAAEGYEYRAADSAEQAIKMLEVEDYFMVITDARLSGMSGYDFLGKARARWPNLPILLIIWPSRSPPKNCCTRWDVAPSAINCFSRMPR